MEFSQSFQRVQSLYIYSIFICLKIVPDSVFIYWRIVKMEEALTFRQKGLKVRSTYEFSEDRESRLGTL